jgi:hypothetical protein
VLIPTDAPPGFAEALEAGDLAFQDNHLAQAAEAWSKARCAADEYDAGPVWVRCSTIANTRLELLLALCVEPALAPERKLDAADRWDALFAVARAGVLAPYFATPVMRLIGMLCPAEGQFPSVVDQSNKAWAVLMACDPLVPPAFCCIDEWLVAQGMHRQRAELARHPSANADAWLGMLERGRTTDLVHTLWETPQAMEDERVREAVGAPAGPGPAETDDETD